MMEAPFCRRTLNLRQYFGYRVCLQSVDQFPSGNLLPVTVGRIMDHFSMFTGEQYLEMAREHAV